MLVAGVGNIIMGDDGAGIEVINRLKGKDLQGVELYEGGTDSFGLLARLRGRNKVIIVDALRGGQKGKVYSLGIEDLRESNFLYSLHDFSFEDLLETGRELFRAEFPAEITVLGIGIEKPGEGIGLSREVERGVVRAVKHIEKEVAGCV